MVSRDLQEAIAIESLGFACPECCAKISAKCVDQEESHQSRLELAVRLVVQTFPPTAPLLPPVAAASIVEPTPLAELPAVPVDCGPPPESCGCDHKYSNHCCQSKWGSPATSRYSGPCLCLCHRAPRSDVGA